MGSNGGRFQVEAMRIQTEHLRVRYGAYTAIEDLDLAVPPGQYVVLVGENGAGKSSLLRCLGGWIRPSQGAVLIDGQRFERHEQTLRSQIKLVPDSPIFYTELTAWEHLELVVRAHHRKDPAWRDEASGWLNAFGLDRNRHAYPASFSRGMQYKLAVVMSILTKPQVFLLDEPFGPLDPFSQSYLAEYLRTIADRGASVIVSTHLLPNDHPPDRVLVMDQGAVILDASLDSIRQQDKSLPLSFIPQQVLSGALAAHRGGAHE